MGYDSETTAFLQREVALWSQRATATAALVARWRKAQPRARKLTGAPWLTWFWLLVAATDVYEWIIWLAHPALFNLLGALFSGVFVAFVVAFALGAVTWLRLELLFGDLLRTTLAQPARLDLNLFRRSLLCSRCYRRIFGPLVHCSASAADLAHAARGYQLDPDAFELPFTLRGDYHPTCLCADALVGATAAAAAADHRLLLTREALTTHQRLDAQIAAAVEIDAADAAANASV